MMIPTIKSRPVVVLSIIKINMYIFFLWIIGSFLAPEFMIRHFLVSWDSIAEGRWWTLITSVFSHNMFFHIFINMYVFFGFGSVLETVMGARKFIIFYLISGIVASFSHCLVSLFLLHRPSLPALGASGSVSGVVLLFSLLFPEEKILILGIIPVPAIFAAILIMGIDIWGLIEQTQGGLLPIGHGAHLGGALVGIVYYFSHSKILIKNN